MSGDSHNSKNPYSAEIFNPATKGSCSVGKLKQARKGSTICNNMVCGGSYHNPEAYKTCERFDGISTFTKLPVRLAERRVHHLCWGLKSGDVLLLGGWGSPYGSSSNTERVSADGSSSSLDFKLPYRIL